MKKQLFHITWPIFIESILFMLLGIVDVLMLGNYSDNAVGAVSIVNQIINMFNIMFGIITSGTTIICVQYLGAQKERKEIRKLISASLILNSALGILISIVLFFFTKPILHAMNVEAVYWDFSKTYLLIVGSTLFIQAISNTFTAALRSHSFTKLCMYTTLIINIINILGNYVLIYGRFGAPKLGVLGAAISTTVSKIIGCLVLGYFVCKRILKGFERKDLSPFPLKELKSVLALGTPAAGESIAYNGSKLVITVILISIGTTAVNANSYLNSITMFVYIFAVAVGQGASILVGRLIGENKKEKAYSLCLSSFFCALLVTVCISIFVLLFSRQFLGIFTSNADIIALSAKILIVDLFLEMGRCANVVIINCLRAAGDVKFPVYIGILSMWGIGVGLGYVFAVLFHWGMIGLWMALALDEILRGILMFGRWKLRIWQKKTII